jgi:hypothetical protein
MRRDLERIKKHLGLDENRGSKIEDGESKRQAG